MTQLLYNKKNNKNLFVINKAKEFISLYSKFYNRENVNIKTNLLDNNGLILTTVQKEGYSSIGKSIILDNKLYSNKFYKNLKFIWFNPTLRATHKIANFSTEFIKKNYIFFYKPTKGGVKCYSTGFKGIMRKKQIVVFLKFLKYEFKTNGFFTLLKTTKKFNLFRVPASTTNITIYSTKKKK